MTYSKTIHSGLTYAQTYTLGGRIELYRSRQNGKLTFFRIAWRRGPMFVGHLGLTNYGWRTRGSEFGPHTVRAGWIAKLPDRQPILDSRWDGSLVEPYHSVTVRIGRLFFGCRAPEWLRRMKHRQSEREHEAWLASLPEAHEFDEN